MMASKGAGGGREGLTLSSNVDREELFDIETVAYNLLMRLVYSDAPVKQGEYMATAMDLRTLAAKLTDEQLLKAAATQLRVPVEDLLMTENHVNKGRANVEENYARINRALALSGEFIRNELKLPLPAEVANARVNSPAELVALLKKTTVFKAGSTGLDRHLAYCALIKGALAAIELETRYAHDLAGEANYLQSVITTQRPENNHMPLVIGESIPTGDEIRGRLSALGDTPCNVTFEIRDKTWQSLMRKFMSKPEANAKESFKDAIAFRFRLDGSREGTVARVLRFFKRQFEGGARLITNKGVMSQADFDGLFANLKEIKGSRGLEVDPKSNPKSDPNFAVLQITGTMKVPPGGDLKVPKRDWRDRSFELQFVDEARKPPTGLASDAVYALKKDAVIATRLLGSFELEWLLEHAIPASLDTTYTNMKAENIVKGLIEQGYIIKKPGKRGKYAATETWENWLNIEGLITDKKMQASLGHAVAEALQKQELAKKKKKNTAE